MSRELETFGEYGDLRPLVVRHYAEPGVPAFVPTAAYAGTWTPEEKLADAKKTLDSTPALDVSLESTPHVAAMINQETTMTLSYKNLSKNGKNAFYSGAAIPFRIPLSAFPGKVAPQTIVVEGEPFAPARTPKAKLTKEERAALPKPTLAEKIAKREAALAALKAKAAADQPSL